MASNALIKARNEIERYRKSAAVARGEAKGAPMKAATSGLLANSVSSAARGAIRSFVPAARSPIADAGMAGVLIGAGLFTGTPAALFAAMAFTSPVISDLVENQITAMRG